MSATRRPSGPVDPQAGTSTVTRRYRRAPGGWWWLALLLVPLVLALLSGLGSSGDDTEQAASSSSSSTPAGTDTVTPSSSLTPTDTASATDASSSASASETATETATPTDVPTATETITASPTETTATVTETVTPSASPTSTVDAAAIGCASFSEDVAGILAANPITFESGGTRLTGSSKATVAAVASALKRCDTMAATVTGHTDNTGSAAANKTISAARAAAVRAELVADGVPESRIGSAGAGQDRPVASNDSAEGRAKNRRVEIVAN